MSFKSIDMQFALHKNMDAGLKQNQLQQKPVEDQTLLNQASDRNITADRQRSAKVDQSAEPGIRDHGAHSGEGYDRERKQGKNEANGENPSKQNHSSKEHPYKGHHIDFTL